MLFVSQRDDGVHCSYDHKGWPWGLAVALPEEQKAMPIRHSTWSMRALFTSTLLAVAGFAIGYAQQTPPEITRDNVSRLQVAWTYRTGETDVRFATIKVPSFEATPIVVDGTMYVGTPLGRVIALDAATGQERWVFDPQIARNIPYSDFANRGVSTWLDEAAPMDTPCRRRIFAATAQSQLIALDARNGQPCSDFGVNGIVDLKTGLRIPPFEPQAYSITSPPIAVNGVVITGSSIGDNSRPDPASGEVRAYDARTGRLRWTWDPIPQDPSDPAYPEWRGALAHKGGGANAWSTLVTDAERDLVFVPTGSAAPDYYGVLRLGDNRYANSIVALRATTGQRVWAFQTVHHDLWDYDNASPPALVTLTRNGTAVPAVMQATKTGMLFVLERETGRPVFPVEERTVPASDIPEEQASRTQPFTSLTPPLSPHRFAVDQVWGITAADRDACRAVIAPLRNEGIFTPPSTRGTLLMPARIGGVNWGRVAVDPVRQVAVIAVNRIAEMVQLIPREGFDLQRARSEEQTRLGDDFEYNMMRGTPYVMRRRLLLAPSRLPCTPPPFGALVAIDLDDRSEDSGRCHWARWRRCSLLTSHRRRNLTGAQSISAAPPRPPAVSCSSVRRSIAGSMPTTSKPGVSCGRENCRRAPKLRL